MLALAQFRDAIQNAGLADVKPESRLVMPAAEIVKPVSDFPPSRRQSRPSLRGSINLKCRECLYDANGAGTWRQQIEACTAYRCPLFSVRPVSESEG